jgi:hypothetical protein
MLYGPFLNLQKGPNLQKRPRILFKFHMYSSALIYRAPIY